MDSDRWYVAFSLRREHDLLVVFHGASSSALIELLATDKERHHHVREER
jgi:ADP-heptose:LPS heptosyltransferase